MADTEKSGGAVFLSFLAGAVVGAGAAIFFAPKTGREMREEISVLTEDAMTRIRTYANEAKDKYNALLEEGREQMRQHSGASSTAPGGEELAWNAEKRETPVDLTHLTRNLR